MNLENLRYFVVLAADSHFGRAAERLFITQPALSHAMGVLQSEIGVPLFRRAGRRMELTLAGEMLREEAQAVLDRLDVAMDRTRGAAP